MADRDLLNDTMIIFTSDHGDYLGDHWMGDKDFFHDPSVKIPLIIADPDPDMDSSRGTECAAPVEAIDVLPTLVEHWGGEPSPHILDGRSLRPWLRGETPQLATLRHQRIRLFPAKLPPGNRPCRPRVSQLHGGNRPLEVHTRAGLSADALRPAQRPCRIE